ncbi:MAG: SdrD B-like domain-containing protein, partial [Micromonosporaceae bacterium]
MTHPGEAAGAGSERSPDGSPDKTGTDGDRSRVAATAGGAAATAAPPPGGGSALQGGKLVTALFLGPALLVLGVLVVYPIIYTAVRSLFGEEGFTEFVGVDNYVEMFTSESTLTSIRNNLIWVIVAPTVVTALGLIFAVLTERVRWSTAFKVVVFMPMAISFLAAGVTFKMVYDQDPEIGVANAVAVTIHDTFSENSPYPGARPRLEAQLKGTDATALTPQGKGFETGAVTRKQPVLLPMVAVKPEQLPAGAQRPSPKQEGDGLYGAVWLDFTLGGGGKNGVVDPKETGLPGMKIQALKDGHVVATTTTDNAGNFTFPQLFSGKYQLRLAPDNFA